MYGSSKPPATVISVENNAAETSAILDEVAPNASESGVTDEQKEVYPTITLDSVEPTSEGVEAGEVPEMQTETESQSLIESDGLHSLVVENFGWVSTSIFY